MPHAPRRIARMLRPVPNILTALRLALIPILWVLAFMGRPVLVGIGALAAEVTDLVDGPLARWTRSTSRFGSAFDSVADHLLTASLVGWVVLLRPEFVREQWPVLAAWCVLALAVLAVGWIRFRRLGDLHLYSAKVAGLSGLLFGSSLLILGTYSAWVFYLVIALGTLGALETLFVFLTYDRVDERVGSILLRRQWRRRMRAGRPST